MNVYVQTTIFCYTQDEVLEFFCICSVSVINKYGVPASKHTTNEVRFIIDIIDGLSRPLTIKKIN